MNWKQRESTQGGSDPEAGPFVSDPLHFSLNYMQGHNYDLLCCLGVWGGGEGGMGEKKCTSDVFKYRESGKEMEHHLKYIRFLSEKKIS